jgi:ketosteroid isomerase-like protein
VRARELDPVRPPVATAPGDVCVLVADAISDGDLEAALAQFEPGAVAAALPGTAVADDLREVLAAAIAARRHYTVAVEHALVAGELALLVAEWHTVGTDGDASGARSSVSTIVRRGADGAWRILCQAARTQGAANVAARGLTCAP